jgi:hypothetical protein
MFWQSRLYPLTEIYFYGAFHDVRLEGAEAERLQHRYGPRPYGPLPEEDHREWPQPAV